MTDRGLRILASSRLHFGLLGWNAQAARPYGSLGLMVESPGLELVAERAPSSAVVGPLATRAEPLIHELARRGLEAGIRLTPARVQILHAPPEHVGLGVGTQLSLAVARALFKLSELPDPTPEQLARLTGRGVRSGVGLHGFLQGGLIVCGGRSDETGTPPLLSRIPFPQDWPILIAQLPGTRGLHGPDETRAFGALPPIPHEMIDALCRIVLLEVLPALRARDLAAFGAALSALQARVGACFAPAQGGVYATPQVAALAEELQAIGLCGVGQSSWGPTLYGFTDRTPREVRSLAEHVRCAFELPESAVVATKATNRGAVLVEGS
jgi:beta-ribofuranosylaminobenzene 5'-phosphate synthase